MSAATVAEFGSTTALVEDAARLRDRAAAAEELARRVRRADVGWWSGEAAEAFADVLEDVVHDILQAADDSFAAASAIERHADVVAWAQRGLAAATPTSPEEADAVLADLHDAVARSARRTADALTDLAAGMARMPGAVDVILRARGQYWGGIGDALGAMVQSSWQMQLARHVIDPVGNATQQQEMGRALWTGLRDDPGGVVREMTDWDTWRTDPVRAMGRQVPDAILSAATAGTGAGAAAGSRVTSALSRATRRRSFEPTARAEAAGHTVEGQRTPGWVTPDGWAVPEWLARAAQRVPEEWGVAAPNKKGTGFRWFGEDPDNDGVRVDQGNLDHRYETQRVHHVVVRRDGRVLGRDGLPLPGGAISSSAEESHIPLTEWMSWVDWGTR